MKKRIISTLVLCISLMFILTMLTACPSSGEPQEPTEEKILLTTDNYKQYLSISSSFKGDTSKLFRNPISGDYSYEGGISEVNVSAVASYLKFENCEITVRVKVKYDSVYMNDFSDSFEHTLTLSIGGTGYSTLKTNCYNAVKIYGVIDCYATSISGYVIVG